jgi:3-hydroxymyristoyl/3-hydroxydecanoyl-(acyl carrier protein) dehydratase
MNDTSEEPRILSRKFDYPVAELMLFVPKQAECFRGHFPDTPVVPGVIQIHWAVQLARTMLVSFDGVKGIENLKFKQVIVPESTIALTLRFAADTNKLHFDYSMGPENFSSGRLVLG